MKEREQKITPYRIETIANHVQDKQEEYKEVLMRFRKLLSESEGDDVFYIELKERMSRTYDQMKEYALFLQSIEAFLRKSAHQLKTK
jgi:hypothetical protein